MTIVELQKNVDSHLGISGDNGRFRITVAKEGMIWTAKESPKYSFVYLFLHTGSIHMITSSCKKVVFFTVYGSDCTPS